MSCVDTPGLPGIRPEHPPPPRVANEIWNGKLSALKCEQVARNLKESDKLYARKDAST
jgi:hypothetical protein